MKEPGANGMLSMNGDYEKRWPRDCWFQIELCVKLILSRMILIYSSFCRRFWRYVL